MPDQRLKGQEVSIRIIDAGSVVAAIDTVSTFNDGVDLEIKEAGYLGEFTNRFDEVLNGFSGDLETNLTRADSATLDDAIIAKAKRESPALVFNVIRTDFFPNGDSNIYTYEDVHWGQIPTTIGARGDFVKKKYQFKCSERTVATNQLP